MPATEQIWRSPKRMHLVFAISSVAMLVTTVWMLAADHHREWKGSSARSATSKPGASNRASSRTKTSNTSTSWPTARPTWKTPSTKSRRANWSTNSSRPSIDAAKQRGADRPNRRADRQDLRRAGRAAADAKRSAAAWPRRRQRLIHELEQFVADARFRESNFLREKKFQAAFFDVDRSEYELGVGNELPPKQLDEIEDQVQKTKSRGRRKERSSSNRPRPSG